MHDEIPVSVTMFRDENTMRWEFLEAETEPCAVVSERMELLYLNEPGRALTLPEWFAKRCFEVLPVSNDECAWHCPTITAVGEAEEITYCEESLQPPDAPELTLGTAVIPLAHTGEDGAKALLMFRRKVPGCDEAAFRDELLESAKALDARVATHLD